MSVAALLGPPVGAHADIRPVVADVCGCSLDVTDAGTIYLADPNARQVYKHDAGGTLAQTWSSGGGLSLVAPSAAVELPNGQVAITDFNAGVIHVVTSSGAFVRDIDSGQVGDVVAGPDGTLYAAGHNSVRRIGADDAVESWPAAWEPRAIALNRVNGHLYVLGGADSTVHEMTTAGVPVRQFGGFGNAPSQLNAPNDIAVDGAGNVYVAQANLIATNGAVTIKKFSSEGAYLGEFRPAGQPMEIAAVGDGLYVLQWSSSNSLVRIDLRSPIAAIAPVGRSLATSQRHTFDASGSSMPFGAITRYEWDLDGDGSYETDTGSTPTATTKRFTVTGERTVRVRVTGSTGATDVATRDLVVSRSAAQLRASAPRALTGEQVRFDASGSVLSDSEIESVRWDLDGDGSYEVDGGTSLATSRSWAAPGTPTVGVRIERSGGVVDTASATVTVVTAPPAGPIGVTINDAAQYTNDPQVTVSVVWPPFGSTVLVSNDGGFRTAVAQPVSHQIKWTLDSSGPERLPKTVYVRFDGATQTYTDDIILDQTAPVVRSAVTSSLGAVPARASAAASDSARSARARRRGSNRLRHRVRVVATDRTSGVAKLQFAVSRRKPSKAVRYRATLVLNGARPRFVRAIDRAGNVSRWKALR